MILSCESCGWLAHPWPRADGRDLRFPALDITFAHYQSWFDRLDRLRALLKEMDE